MAKAKFFGWSNFCICFLASVSYALEKDWRRAIYWLLAAGIAATITW
jgi:hypothetical protein